MTAASPAKFDTDVESPAEPAPKRFVQVPEAAYSLPALQLKVLIGLLRFCWNGPYCWPSQETLAEVIVLPRRNVRRGLRELAADGVITITEKRDRKGRHSEYRISPGFWNAPQNPKVSAGSAIYGHEVDSTYKEEKTPVAPADAGEAAPDLSIEVEDDAPAAIEPGEPPPNRGKAAQPPANLSDRTINPRTFGPCERCGAERATPAPSPCARCGSTRRTPYGQPRAPRRPRPSRQRQRRFSLYDAFMEAAAADQTTAAQPARPALPPPPDIIPPGHDLVAGEVIPMPRQPLPRPRGFSPATDIMEAFYNAAGIPLRETPDRAGDRDPAGSLLAIGREPGNAPADRRRMAG